MNKHLWQCESFAEQNAWCKAQFENGRILSYPGIWLGGAEPDKIVRALRRAGMPLITCRVTTIDAEGTVHPKTLAWRMKTPNVGGNRLTTEWRDLAHEAARGPVE